jgi:signal peptidase I
VDEHDGAPPRRHWFARIVWTLFGTVFPGIALLRFRRWFWGIALFLIPFAALFGTPFLLATVPDLSPMSRVWVIAGAVGAVLLASLLSLILGWRASRWRTGVVNGFIILLLVAGSVAANLLIPFPIRNFHIPSESMRPALEVGDRLVAVIAPPRTWPRGSVVIYHVGDNWRVGRIVAFGGERFAMAQGRVMLNGRAAEHRRVAPESDVAFEQLPGEAAGHYLIDKGQSAGDAFAEVTVPAGHLVILGDNRDNSADSRFDPAQHGTGMVPAGDIWGTVEFIYWSRETGFGVRGIDP